MKTISLSIAIFISVSVHSQHRDSLRTADSIQKVLYDLHNQQRNNNALPYLHCPLEIKFEPYDSVAGYILLYDTNKVLYKQLDIHLPQYHYLIYEACDWPKQKFTAYLFSNNGTKLNGFTIANPPQKGQIGNVGPYTDLRKFKKSRSKRIKKTN